MTSAAAAGALYTEATTTLMMPPPTPLEEDMDGECGADGDSGEDSVLRVRARKVSLVSLNDQLKCPLCRGYYIDATTISECLHSFCRSCIVKYLSKSNYCPVCDVQVHQSRPLLNIRPDTTLQSIVYKLVPKLLRGEMRKRQKFYKVHKKEVALDEADRGHVPYQHYLCADDIICVSVYYFGNPITKRYLQCSAAVTVYHLQKLLRAKYDLGTRHRIDVMRKDDVIKPYWTLIDVAHQYVWDKKSPLDLSYRIYEYITQAIVTPPSAASDPIDQPAVPEKRRKLDNNEWKEVQIQISENGEMSVTGIDSNEASTTTNTAELVSAEETVADEPVPSLKSLPLKKESSPKSQRISVKNVRSKDKKPKRETTPPVPAGAGSSFEQKMQSIQHKVNSLDARLSSRQQEVQNQITTSSTAATVPTLSTTTTAITTTVTVKSSSTDYPAILLSEDEQNQLIAIEQTFDLEVVPVTKPIFDLNRSTAIDKKSVIVDTVVNAKSLKTEIKVVNNNVDEIELSTEVDAIVKTSSDEKKPTILIQSVDIIPAKCEKDNSSQIMEKSSRKREDLSRFDDKVLMVDLSRVVIDPKVIEASKAKIDHISVENGIKSPDVNGKEVECKAKIEKKVPDLTKNTQEASVKPEIDADSTSASCRKSHDESVTLKSDTNKQVNRKTEGNIKVSITKLDDKTTSDSKLTPKSDKLVQPSEKLSTTDSKKSETKETIVEAKSKPDLTINAIIPPAVSARKSTEIRVSVDSETIDLTCDTDSNPSSKKKLDLEIKTSIKEVKSNRVYTNDLGKVRTDDSKAKLPSLAPIQAQNMVVSKDKNCTSVKSAVPSTATATTITATSGLKRRYPGSGQPVDMALAPSKQAKPPRVLNHSLPLLMPSDVTIPPTTSSPLHHRTNHHRNSPNVQQYHLSTPSPPSLYHHHLYQQHQHQSDRASLTYINVPKVASNSPTASTPPTPAVELIKTSDKRNAKASITANNNKQSQGVYKKFRDPPRIWNPQLLIRPSSSVTVESTVPAVTTTITTGTNVNKSCATSKAIPDLKTIRPRTQMRFLGCPVSGFKPLYNRQDAPTSSSSSSSCSITPTSTSSSNTHSDKKDAACAEGVSNTIRKHSIVRIDPKTQRPVSEKAPRNNTLARKTDGGAGGGNAQAPLGSATPCRQGGGNSSPSGCVTMMGSPGGSVKSPTMSRSKDAPAVSSQGETTKLNAKPPAVKLNYTPPNPFIPSLPTSQPPAGFVAAPSPGQFLYPPLHPHHYDPLFMSAYHHYHHSMLMNATAPAAVAASSPTSSSSTSSSQSSQQQLLSPSPGGNSNSVATASPPPMRLPPPPYGAAVPSDVGAAAAPVGVKTPKPLPALITPPGLPLGTLHSSSSAPPTSPTKVSTVASSTTASTTTTTTTTVNNNNHKRLSVKDAASTPHKLLDAVDKLTQNKIRESLALAAKAQSVTATATTTSTTSSSTIITTVNTSTSSATKNIGSSSSAHLKTSSSHTGSKCKDAKESNNVSDDSVKENIASTKSAPSSSATTTTMTNIAKSSSEGSAGVTVVSSVTQKGASDEKKTHVGETVKT